MLWANLRKTWDVNFLLRTWNVRTLWKPRAKIMLYKMRITSIQKTLWLRWGIRDTEKHTILYNGKNREIERWEPHLFWILA